MELPSGGLTQIGALPAASVTMRFADVNNSIGPRLTASTLAAVIVRGKDGGSSGVSLSVKALDDDQGQPIAMQLQLGGITVRGQTVCPQLPGQTVAARDLDADGRCEDINGNGRKDFADVVGYFNDMGSPAVVNSVSLFDFNGNRRIDFDDVARLFNIVTGR